MAIPTYLPALSNQRAYAHSSLLVICTPAHATFPGKNGRIVFAMNPDGTDVKQLTSFSTTDASIHASPLSVLKRTLEQSRENTGTCPACDCGCNQAIALIEVFEFVIWACI